MEYTHSVAEGLKVVRQKGFKWRWVLKLAAVFLLTCCTATEPQRPVNFDDYIKPEPQSKRPFSDKATESETRNFAHGNLPFGIGAKFNLTLEKNPQSSGDRGNLFKDVIQPLRRGKIMSRTPVEMNYSILPSSGEAFNHSGGLDNGAIKSNYKLQIGMSRHVYKASDLLTADFWLAKGKYNPNKPKITYREAPETSPFSEDESFHTQIPGWNGEDVLQNGEIPAIR